MGQSVTRTNQPATRRRRSALALLALALALALATLAALPAGALAFISTGDGGWFWQNPLPQGNDLTSVTFTDSSHGWAVGEAGTILATSDGGATWNGQSSGTNARLWAVAFTDPSHGWAVGGDGIILATTDGGTTWTKQSSGTNEDLYSVTFTDSSHGWAVGESYDWSTGTPSSVILATTDGGATWTQQHSAANAHLSSVTFTDASHGWVVGYSGTILATTDGGATWTQQSSGTGYALYSVTFTDSFHGWAVGDEGTILATTTGGWAPSGPSQDTTPPVTTDDAPAGWQNAPVTVHLTASDPSPGSGIAHTYYTLDGGSQTEGTSVTVAAPADHSGDGTHTITYWSVDKAGNVEDPHTCTVTIDTPAR